METILTKSEDMTSRIMTFDEEHYYSRYNPQKEADRFIDSLKINKHSICILIAPGLPYLFGALQKKFPGIRCISLQPELLGQYMVTASNSSSHDVGEEWIESSNIGLSDFLFNALTDVEAEHIETIIWPPAYKHFREFCTFAVAEILKLVKVTSANLNTLSFFGTRWLKNIVSNFTHIENFHSLPQSTGLVVLAGSGPGLNDCIDILKSNRKSFILWSLPSSLRALSYAGLKPDVVVSSDAGFWAGAHLAYLNTWKSDSVPPVIIAPSRAMLRPIWSESALPVSLLSMDLPFEQIMFDSIWNGDKKEHLPESLTDRGTVAITALDLLERCHRGIILTLGIDFAWKDLQSHARPHTFDEVISGCDNRLRTFDYLRYVDRERQPSYKIPGIGWYRVEPLDLYRTWLHSGWKLKHNEVVDYNPSKVEKNFKSVDLSEIKSILLGNRINLSLNMGQKVKLPVRNDRKKIIDSVLEKYRVRLCNMPSMNNELQEICLMLNRKIFNEYRNGDKVFNILKQELLVSYDSMMQLVSKNDK